MINYNTDAVRKFAEQCARGTPSITMRSKDDLYTGEPQRAKKAMKATKATSSTIATQFATDGTITVSHTATTISQVETNVEHLANFVAPALLDAIPQLVTKSAQTNTPPRLPTVTPKQAQPIEMRIFKSVSDTIGAAKTTTLSKLFEKLKSPIVTPETMEEYTSLPKDEQAKLKDRGLYLLGVTDGKGKREENLVHRTAGAIDIDSDTDDNTEEKFKHALQGIEFVYHTTRKSRRDAPRYRVIVPFSEPVTAQEYKKVMQHLLNHLQGYGVTADECSLKATQCMYFPTISSDQNVHYNKRIAHVATLADDTFTEHRYGLLDVATILNNFTPQPPKKATLLPPKTQKSVPPKERNGLEGAFCRAYDPHEAIQTFLPHMYEFEAHSGRYRHCDSTSGMAGVVVNPDETIHSFGESDPFKTGSAYQLVLRHKFHGDKSAMQLHCNTDERIVKEQAQKLGEGEEWRAQLIRTESGEIKRTAVNVKLIIEHDTRLNTAIAHNSFSSFFEVTNAPWRREKQAKKEFMETDFDGLMEYLGEVYGRQFYNETATKAVLNGLRRRNQYDPLQEYMKEAEQAWDGVPRVCDVFIKYLGAENNQYIKDVTAHFFKGGVARTLNEGSKFDEMIVLIGRQGLGKSTILRKLAIEEAYFLESLESFSGADAYESLQGRFIVEVAELVGLSKSNQREAKKFISATCDVYREKYEKHARPHYRRCIFAGTTNESSFLNDPTGGRRFLPITCHGVSLKKMHEELTPEEVQQIWGEAVHLYKANPILVLPEETAIYARQLQEEHTQRPQGIQVFEEWLATEGVNFVSEFTLYENYLEISPSGRTNTHDKIVKEIMDYMKHTLKWEYDRTVVNGVRQRGYRRPKTINGGV